MSISKVGLSLTAIWVLFSSIVIYKLPGELYDLGLNEFGDLLSGVTAPIAFLWLVLGFYQQREELKLNTRALLLQQDELKNQVAETKALVAQSARHAEATEELSRVTKLEIEAARNKDEIDAQPIFVVRGGTTTSFTANRHFENHGDTAWDISIIVPEPIIGTFQPNKIWSTGDGGSIDFEKIPEEVFAFDFEIKYKDKFTKYHKQKFRYEHPNTLYQKV